MKSFNTIEEAWEDYRKECFSDVDERTRRILQATFFQGASAFAKQVVREGRGFNPRQFMKLYDEILAFLESFGRKPA